MRAIITLKGLQDCACAKRNLHIFEKQKIKKKPKKSKRKTWIEFRLNEFSKGNNLTLKTEFKFHEKRKWRFDWAFPEIKIAFEYEGIFSDKSRHTTVKGFTGDTEKYNAAQKLGWKVFRYTAMNYLDLVIDLIDYKR